MLRKFTITAATALAVVGMVGTGITVAAEPAEAPVQVSPKTAAASPTTFTVLGDSITAGCQLVLTDRLEPCTWPYWVDATPDAVFVGGYAQGGANTILMTMNATPHPADVLIILAGINDQYGGYGFDTTAANLLQLAGTVGAREVLLLGIGPGSGRDLNGNPTSTLDVNAGLQALARSQGWSYFDPWAPFRNPDNTWNVPTTNGDGVHPLPDTQQQVGETIAAYVAARY